MASASDSMSYQGILKETTRINTRPTHKNQLPFLKTNYKERKNEIKKNNGIHTSMQRNKCTNEENENSVLVSCQLHTT